MLGRGISKLQKGPRRWLYRFWGVPSVHTRQKWAILWPSLAKLPEHDIFILDAGCGRGEWSLEIATRRPNWQVLGVDKDSDRIDRAEMNRKQLGIKNVVFTRSDFLEFQPASRADIVISVASAHYLVVDGLGPALFERFRSWLKPGGLLLLLGPRSVDEAPFATGLGRPEWHRVFTRPQIRLLCEGSGLSIEELGGRIGRLGTIAKQLEWSASGAPSLLRVGLYPFEVGLALADRERESTLSLSSTFWLLRARSQ